MRIRNFIKPRQTSIDHYKVREILNDADSFKKYVLHNNNKSSNEINSEGELYALYVTRYHDYLKNHGYKFNKLQRRIIRKCKNIKENKFFDYTFIDFDLSPETIKENCKLRKIVIELIKDENKLKAFFYGKIKLNGTTYEELCKYVLQENSICQYFIKNNIHTKDSRLTRNIYLLELYCSERKYNIDHKQEEKFEVDSKLKTKIFSQVSQELLNKKNRTNEEQVELAYQIFYSMNRALSYDEKMHIEDQRELRYEHNSVMEIYKSYYKNPADITPNNNSVACRSWAYLYAKLLNDVNIKAFVAHPFVHKKVLFLDNDARMYIADGTQFQNNLSFSVDIDTFRMTDMERAKLGLKTTNFMRVSLDKENTKVQEIYVDGKFKKAKLYLGKLEGKFKGAKARIKAPFSCKEYGMFKDFFIRALKSEPIGNDEYKNVKNMLKLIEEAGKMPEIFVNPCGENGLDRKKSFAIKIKLINRILLSIEPHIANDNTVIRALASNLKHWLLENEEIEQLDRFYILDENNNVKVRPVLYMNSCEEAEGSDKRGQMEVMYIWDNKKGFVRTTPDQIKAKLKKSELYYNYNVEDDRFCRSDLEYEIEHELEDDKDYRAFKGYSADRFIDPFDIHIEEIANSDDKGDVETNDKDFE